MVCLSVSCSVLESFSGNSIFQSQHLSLPTFDRISSVLTTKIQVPTGIDVILTTLHCHCQSVHVGNANHSYTLTFTATVEMSKSWENELEPDLDPEWDAVRTQGGADDSGGHS